MMKSDKQQRTPQRVKPFADDLPRWLHVTRNDLDEALCLVQDGDTDAALSLIQYFHERMTMGADYDAEILHQYAAMLFARLAHGETFGVALGLVKGRGQYERDSTWERKQSLAARVQLHILEGLSPTYAIFCVSKETEREALRASEKTVRDAFTEWGGELTHYSIETLRDLI